jgi:hypothetical protein
MSDDDGPPENGKRWPCQATVSSDTEFLGYTRDLSLLVTPIKGFLGEVAR